MHACARGTGCMLLLQRCVAVLMNKEVCFLSSSLECKCADDHLGSKGAKEDDSNASKTTTRTAIVGQ
jgi:hypothetical protein